MTDFFPNLLTAQRLINELLDHIQSFNIDSLIYHAPIEDRIKFRPNSSTALLAEDENGGRTLEQGLDTRSGWRQDEIMGLKKFVDSVKHHSAQIDNSINSGILPQDDPLPSIVGLITYWKIVISARPPVVGLRIGMIPRPRSPTSTSGSSAGAMNGWTTHTAQVQNSKGKDKGGSKGGREKEVWVDVIAQGGKEWIRIYSKKISHLLAEFREADSYVNSDYDSDSSSCGSSSSISNSRLSRNGGNGNGSGNGIGCKVEAGLDNSLVKTAKELLMAASNVERIPGASIPILTMRLTRIPPAPPALSGHDHDQDQDEGGEEREVECEWPDSRIEKSFDIVRQMGINLVFGDLSEMPLEKAPTPTTGMRKKTIPSLKFNLDITTLMGLCSDVLHYPLPRDKAEAKRRSLRPSTHLLSTKAAMMGRGRDGTGKGNKKQQKENDDDGSGSDDEEELKGQSQNSRELYKCLREEMERPFIEEFNKVVLKAYRARQRASTTTPRWKNGDGNGLVDRLSSLHNVTDDNVNVNVNVNIPTDNMDIDVEFWTTHQAAQYTYEALTSGPAHGEGGEQRRMLVMLGLGQGDFFTGSRYKGCEGVFKDFKLRIFDCEKFVPGEVVEPGQYGDGSQVITGQDDDGENDRGKTGFHHTLQWITSTFLSEYYEQTISRNASKNKSLPSFLQPKKIPTPPIAKISLPFPVVSLHSLERGAREKEGMTTIMMGTATLKEVWSQSRWRVRGWERGYYSQRELPLLPTHTPPQRHIEPETETERGKDTKKEDGVVDIANTAIIIFPYRVFGEGKRVKFESGDWTYPSKLAEADD